MGDISLSRIDIDCRDGDQFLGDTANRLKFLAFSLLEMNEAYETDEIKGVGGMLWDLSYKVKEFHYQCESMEKQPPETDGEKGADHD